MTGSTTPNAAPEAAAKPAVRRAETPLETAGAVAHFAGWEVDLPPRTVWWSAQAFALFELPPGPTPTVEETIAFCVPEYRATLRACVEACARDGAPYDEHIAVSTAGARRISLHASGRALRAADGTVMRIQCAFQQIAQPRQPQDDSPRLAAQLANTLDSMSEAFFTMDSALRFTYLNQEASALLQRGRAELLGKLVWEEFPQAVGGPSYLAYAQALREQCNTSFEEFYPPLGRWFEVRCYPTDDGLAVYFHDISERKEARIALKQAHRALQMLSRCNHVVAHAGRESELIDEICRIAVEVGGYRMAWVGYAEEDEAHSVTIAAHAGSAADVACLRNLMLGWAEENACGRGPAGLAIRSGSAVMVEDMAQDFRFAAGTTAEAACGYGGAAYLPLKDGARTFGLLSLYAQDIAEGDADEVRLLQELADNLAFGINTIRVRLEQEKMQAAVTKVAASVSTATGERFFEQLATTMAESVGADGGFVSRLLPGSPLRARTVIAVVDGARIADFDYSVGDSPCELALEHEHYVVTAGNLLTVQVGLSLITNDAGQPEALLSINTDITARKAAEREIERLAFYDPTTGLPNRLLLLDRLQHALSITGRSGATGALLFIDLDNFKSINDTLGHDKGDQLLRQVAKRLRACVYEIDTVARFGGDEFVVLVENLSRQRHEAASQARKICERILRAFGEPILLDNFVRHTTASIGVTLFDSQQCSASELLKQADLAMYGVKAAGRNGARFFDPEMQTVVTARAALEADLRYALQHDEFLLHYQPQVDRDGVVTGAEALIRWHSASRGPVSPAAFIPIAEETGLILPIGRWVLEQACRQLASWGRQPDLAQLSISVNVSARQLHQPGFVDEVTVVVAAAAIDPQRLKLEITESLLVDDTETAIATMNRLKARGVGFSLDDFGTGYSSLNYLKRLPLDQLKIDQSFVRDGLSDPHDAAIAQTIIALGRCLQLNVIAEGVETVEQHAFLMAHGCHAFQGYLFSRPVPADSFEQFARLRSAAP